MCGGSWSTTITRNVQEFVLPLASVATLVTLFVPRLKREPEAGVLTTVAVPQLSVASTVKFTIASVRPVSAGCTMLAGQVTCGASVAFTVTWNVFVTEFPEASVARQVTTVLPFWNVEPLGGTQTRITGLEQRSNTVGSKLTTALQLPASVCCEMSGGSVSAGICLSSIVMVKAQEALLPAASVAVQFTVFVPTGNADPEGGTHA